MHTLVIAEIGSCHDASLDKALHLIDEAADAGADAAKIQFWSDPLALAARRRVPPHYRDIYTRYQLPQFWLPPIFRQCRMRQIKLAITTYLPQDVATIEPHADYFKVASFEAEARDLLQAHLPFVGPRPVIISLGMGAYPPPYGMFGANARYLHCVSAYPAPVEALNLQRLWDMPTIAIQRGRMLDGFSDHSDPSLTWTGALAVAAGATIVEAHLRLIETDARNPDAPHAMSPLQFRDYVRHIRFSENCMGTSERTHQPLPCEEPMAAYRVRTP